MKLRLLKIFGLVALLWTLGSCTGVGPGDNGNPLSPTPPVPVFGDFVLNVATSGSNGTGGNIKAYRSDSGKALGFFNNGILVDETRNTVSDISFEPDNEVAEIDFPGTFVVELVTQGNTVNVEFPDFGVTTIPFDTYHSFEMKFDKLRSEDIPSDLLQDPLVTQLLLDQTFVVIGRFFEGDHDVNGNGKFDYVTFQIISDNEVEVEVSSPNFFTVSPSQVNYFFIAFLIDEWFNGLLPKFQQLTPSDLVNGVAVITDDSSNPLIQDILDTFESNTETSCKSAPSDNDEFEEGDVDPESGSGPKI